MLEAVKNSENRDEKTVDSFGAEWERFDQSVLDSDEKSWIFDTYFAIFPFMDLPEKSEGFDMGCGSGRWAQLVAPKVNKLNCIDPAIKALNVAKRNLAQNENVVFHNCGVDGAPIEPESQDFGYSLGVLHHIPDTGAALNKCASYLKQGAPFLVYLYYRFDNRPAWFRGLWRASEIFRSAVSKLPDKFKPLATDVIAGLVYFPLAKTALIAEKLGISPKYIPLSYYRDTSFYTMRTDSRDRFGTPLEQRFTRAEIETMMKNAGLRDIRFSEAEPFWVAVGIKGPQTN